MGSEIAAVVLGAAIGAPLRYASERAMLALTTRRLPLGTLIANLVGCAIAGAALAVARAGGMSEWWTALLIVGFCGALTTFSGFSAQVLELSREGARRFDWAGVAYALVSMAGGIGLAVIAFAVVSGAAAGS